MSNYYLSKYMPLKEGETVIGYIEGDAYNMDSNVIARFLGFIVKILSFITGTSQKVHLFVTDKRVILISVGKILWFIDGDVRSVSYTPRAISSSGYALGRSLLFFKTHYLTFTSTAEAVMIKSKSGMKDVMDLISKITNLADPVTSK